MVHIKYPQTRLSTGLVLTSRLMPVYVTYFESNLGKKLSGLRFNVEDATDSVIAGVKVSFAEAWKAIV